MPHPSSTNVIPDAAILDQLELEIAGDASTVDEAATFPHISIAGLSRAGLLLWPFVKRNGHHTLPERAELRDMLVRTGRASLTVGRLFEGHVNGAVLLDAYGSDVNCSLVIANAVKGHLIGVWNAERGDGLVARRCIGGWRLHGEKIYCSGAGSIERPIVTARIDGVPDVLMMIPQIVGNQVEVDLSRWRPAGMRGTATGTVRFDNVFVPDICVIGQPGDYYRSPLFSGGAWRVLAVQLGGLQHIVGLHAQRLNDWNRDGDASARARFAVAAQNLELARLLVDEASRRAIDHSIDPAAIDAYVDAARGAFETLALSIIDNTRRNIGLSTYIAPDPLDLVIRDLETYLRQPFLDLSRDNAAKWLLRQKGRFA